MHWIGSYHGITTEIVAAWLWLVTHSRCDCGFQSADLPLSTAMGIAMKRLLLCALVLTTLSFAVGETPVDNNDDGPRATKLTPLMQMKLDKSKAILEGLTLEDFDKIKSSARSLHLLSTESGWSVIQTQEYADQSRDFQRAANLVAEAADAKDIHRATLGYVAMTVRCVECHSYMRKHQAESNKRNP